MSRHEKRIQFPTTRWSLLEHAADTSRDDNRRALGELLTRYMPALRAHLVYGRGIPSDQADDMLQCFIQTKFLEQNLAELADRSRGRFRALLVVALDRFVVSVWRNERAKRHRPTHGASIEPALLDRMAVSTLSPSIEFEIEWARRLLAVVLERMKEECQTSNHSETWEVFELRLLGPIQNGETAPSYEDVVKRLGFRSPSQACNALMTAKRMFQRHLRAVVLEYAGHPEAVDEEIRELMAALSATGAGSILKLRKDL